MIGYVSRGLISIALAMVWVAAIWLVVQILFAEQEMLVGDSIAIGCAMLAPIFCLAGWALNWVAEKSPRHPRAQAA
jgi:hypothetical protein